MKIKTIVGLKSIKTVFNDIINTGEEILGWGATNRAAQLLPKFTKEYLKKREEKNITARQIYVEDSPKLESSVSKWKKMPGDFTLPATTLIYGNKVALMLWFSKPIMAILIENKELAQSYRNYFEFIWQTRIFNLEEILKTQILNTLIKTLFKDGKIQTVDRKNYYILKKQIEDNDKIRRIILLPPGIKTASNFTGIKEFNLMSPHSEYEEASIEIKGGLMPGRQGFSKIKSALKFSYYTKSDITPGQKKYYKEIFKSTHEPKFKVVKPDGWGFYHNLTNKTNEWLCLVLEAKLLNQKTPNIILNNFSLAEKAIINDLIHKLESRGDYLFKEDLHLVEKIINLNQNKILPILIELLNIKNRGNHEPCTIFALILKIGKKNKTLTIKLLETALQKDLAPKFYLRELLRKLKK
jgi:hypothetical protein